MFSHTTIRHSYDFSQHMVEMAVEASQPQSEDMLREGEQADQQESALVKIIKAIRETFEKV